MTRRFALLSTALILGVTVAATTARPDDEFGREAFERIKSMAGDWVAVEDGTPTKTVVSRSRVTAGGHAVLETVFPGTEMEMVTVYHLDGDDLVLQHYCVLGNQPRMVARAGKSPDQIAFDFESCCNLESPDAAHMREATIQFIGKDRIRSNWYQYENGENNYTASFELARRQDG